MSTSKAAIVATISGRHLRGLPNPTRRVRAAQRLENIKEIAATLLDEANALEHYNAIAESAAAVTNLNPKSGINFFDEVRRFETLLIKRALKLTKGNQARAAKLLGLGTTTLNYKIKTYELL